MSHFVEHVVEDMRTGRETWRVYLTLCGPALAISVAVMMARFG
jgi:hypothetical protein